MANGDGDGLRETVTTFLASEEDKQSGEDLSTAMSAVLTFGVVVANIIGATAVLAVIYLVLPLPEVDDSDHVRMVNAVLAAAYIPLAIVAGVILGKRALTGLQTWLRSESDADDRVRRMVIEAPLRLFRLQAALWFGAAVLFGVLDVTYSVGLAAVVSSTIAITGVTTGACAYLVAERILRKPASRALADETPSEIDVPGVATRAVLAWALGTGGPLIGLMAVGISSLAGLPASETQLEVAIVALGGIAVAVGLLAVVLAARATADPIDAVRIALETVQSGDFDVRVPVYDGTQIGRLQLGFNRMAEGLAEREQIRETLGTYVDPDVAERILKEGVQLEGEEVDATMMFIDVRDFTAFAEQHDAPEVVAAINALFEEAIPVIHEHGGRIDKFVGDGLLAVFGAPRRLENHADDALAVALELAEKVRDGELKIGIGLNSGPVVAGNVGGAGRFEFSVMGDAVNVAARVESATRDTGDEILISEGTRERLSSEPVEFHERGGIELKGKSTEVRLFAPGSAE